MVRRALLESLPADVPTEFVAYQYYLRVVPTTYVAPRTRPLHTNQYSVTHYERKLSAHSGVPGIFFKFDIEPVRLTLIQRTTTLAQFFIRCVTLLPFASSRRLISVPQLCRRCRGHIRLCILGPPRNRPRDISRRRAR